MENQLTMLWEVSFVEFLMVTVVLAGGAAWMTGRAVARGWESNLRLVTYMVLLAAATRFVHYALFGGSLLSAHYFAVDFLVITVIALIGKQVTRRRQMNTQYRFEQPFQQAAGPPAPR
jgi:cation transport ATPase